MSGESDQGGCGCLIGLLVAFAFPMVWIGGCAAIRHLDKQREEIYQEVWKDAPELERQHGALAAEIARLHEFRADLEQRRNVFVTETAKQEADRKIAAVDAQIERLGAQRTSIISLVEQQALTNVSNKVENSMQREAIARLESETEALVGDAESLRREIEAGVAGDPVSDGIAPGRANTARPPVSKPAVAAPQDPSQREGEENDASGGIPGSGKAPKKSRSAAGLFETRIWNDRYGHRVSARLLHVSDSRGNAVATLGTDPIDIAASDWVVHLQRQDGAIIRVPAVKFSSRDLDFLSEGE